MAFDKNISVKPIKFGTTDVTFDERGSSFLAMRRIQWCKDGDEPDESKARLELRKWIVDKDGSELANKGFSFLTDDGPHELAKALVKEGFGKTGEILGELVKRDDFKDAVNNFGKDEEDGSDEDYFDMRQLLTNLDVVEDEE